MYVLEGTVVNKKEQLEDDEEFLRRLEDEGFAESSYEAKEKTVAEELRRVLGGANGKGFQSGSFLQVKEGLDELVSVQSSIDRRIRINNSPVLYVGERVVNRAMAFVRPGTPVASLDQLFEQEVQVIKGLSAALSGALAYSGQVLDTVVEYRDGVVLVKFAAAIDGYRDSEQRAHGLVALFRDADERLGRTQVTDPQYMRLYRAHGALKRELMKLDNELSKFNQATVFRRSELDVLTTHLELVNYGVLLMDRLNSYVADVAEHVENTRGVYQFFRDGSRGMDSIYMAFGELSRCVMLGARDMGEQIGRMAFMARAANSENTVPDVLGRVLSGYKEAIFAADSRNRSNFDAKAASIRGSYGLG